VGREHFEIEAIEQRLVGENLDIICDMA